MALKGLQGYFDVSKSLAELCGQYEFSMNRRMVLDTLPPPVLLLLLRWEITRELTLVNFVRSFPHPPHPKCNALLVQLQDRTQNLHSSILVQIHICGHLSNLNFTNFTKPAHCFACFWYTASVLFLLCQGGTRASPTRQRGQEWSWQDGQGQA